VRPDIRASARVSGEDRRHPVDRTLSQIFHIAQIDPKKM
jgi:hypothetical protein